MRAAVITSALVIATLVVWANLRDVPRGAQHAPEFASALEAAALPDVAAAPEPALVAEHTRVETSVDDADLAYSTATVPPAREHVVAAGETLAGLAQRYYGDPTRAADLYAANRDRIRDPEQLHAGQTLIIP